MTKLHSRIILSLLTYVTTTCLSLANNFTFSTNTPNANTITITGYAGTVDSLVIPSAISNKVVTAIGYGAFQDRTSLTNVTFPDSLTFIDSYAFEGCIGLTAINFPDNLNNLGTRAFADCTGLTSVDIPDNVITVGWSAFYRSSLTNVTLGANVTSIEPFAFGDCSLKNIIIPSRVTSIGNWAFQKNYGLKEAYFMGDAPTTGPSIFLGNNQVTVYYLGGTDGWDTALAGRPTALWLSPRQCYINNSGVQSNEFGFNIIGTANEIVVVEVSTNLTSGWIPVASNTIPVGLHRFDDLDWGNYSNRFYRLSIP